MTDDFEERAAKMILDGFQRDGLATMCREQQEIYLATAVQASYQLLRGVAGDEYMRGWLDAWLADLANPPLIQLRRPS